MAKKNSMQSSKAQTQNSFSHYITKGFVSGALVFALCILIMPILLLQSSDPASFVSAASAGIVALTALFSAFAASRGNSMHFMITGVITALIISILITVLSLVFGNDEGEKNIIFPLILYGATLLFSLFGAFLGSRKKKTRRRR